MKDYDPTLDSLAEHMAAITHERRMAEGCIHCRPAVKGRVCPSCYQCLACGNGCMDCEAVRPRV